MNLRPNAYETSALPLSYAAEKNVAGAGIEPASGDYEPPDVPFVHPAEISRQEDFSEAENFPEIMSLNYRHKKRIFLVVPIYPIARYALLRES